MRDGRPEGNAAVVSAVAAVAVSEIVVVGASGLESESEVAVDTMASARDDSVRMNVRSEATLCTRVVVVDVGTLSVTEPETLTEGAGLPLGNAGAEELTGRELTGCESMGCELAG
jgi:hypothetical protein